ncbi:MAG: glycosyltransferase [Ruminococcus sp.]|nr:glycosyltransferase [Ruminococcus sp.]
MEKPIISIICNAYNHEKYIAQALDSFLMQKVNVPFEILVHDDSSTDRTPEIIRKYEDRYPGLVKSILQKENQMSQGLSITVDIQLPRALGKYIAFCEGDDYWTNENKLQIQYDFMEEHPEYSICCHAYNMVDKDGNLLEERRDFPEDCIVPMERLIGNQLEVPHFATMMVRKECLSGLGREFLGEHCSDMIIRLYCAAQKDIYFINQNMSCYRRFTESSWTVNVGQDKEMFLELRKTKIVFLKEYNDYTQYKYNRIIEKVLNYRQFEIDMYEGNYRAARRNPSFKTASLKRRIGITVGCVFPGLVYSYLNKQS